MARSVAFPGRCTTQYWNCQRTKLQSLNFRYPARGLAEPLLNTPQDIIHPNGGIVRCTTTQALRRFRRRWLGGGGVWCLREGASPLDYLMDSWNLSRTLRTPPTGELNEEPCSPHPPRGIALPDWLVQPSGRTRSVKNNSGSIVIVFKDGHRQSFNLSDVARVEFAGGPPPFPRTATEFPAVAGSSANGSAATVMEIILISR